MHDQIFITKYFLLRMGDLVHLQKFYHVMCFVISNQLHKNISYRFVSQQLESNSFTIYLEHCLCYVNGAFLRLKS